MLTQIIIKNFKCFQHATTIPLNTLNLLTGINGRGKSTTLQSLLLMRQSPEHSRTTNQLIFNGSCVDLGNFNDVKNSLTSQREAIEFRFQFTVAKQGNSQKLDLKYAFGENIEDDMVANIEQFEIEGIFNQQRYHIYTKVQQSETPQPSIPYSNYTLHYKKNTLNHTWYNLVPDELPSDFPIPRLRLSTSFNRIHYISADRIGPQDYYAKQSFTEFPNVGRRGEYTANVLSKKKNQTVYEMLCLESGETQTVLDQTAAWLSTIFDGGKIKVEPVEANIVLLKLNTTQDEMDYKPINVGFGYTYALPIIVSGLIAQQGDILIVENPEAHLHPYAQAQISKFLAKVSACGIQVFIESHSDHVLNSLRVAILDKIINPTDLNILYFQTGEATNVTQIPVKADGAIEIWPEGFFDQTDKDYQRLFGF